MYSLLSKRSLDNLGYFNVDIYSIKIYHHCNIYNGKRMGTTIINSINNVWDGTYPIIGIGKLFKKDYIVDYGKNLSIRRIHVVGLGYEKITFTLFNYKDLNGKFEVKHNSFKLTGNFKLGTPVMPWRATLINGICLRIDQIKLPPKFIKNNLNLVKESLINHLTISEWKLHPMLK